MTPRSGSAVHRGMPSSPLLGGIADGLYFPAYTALLPKLVDPADLLDASGEGPHVVIDGRNKLDPQRWREAGWTYQALGRPNI